MAEVSPLEKILNNPGFEHLAEIIFWNLDQDHLEVCGQINESSKQILANPMFWIRKFKYLSKENQKDWIKVIQSVKNSVKEKSIISYLKWNLKKDALKDLSCYSSRAVQDDFRNKIWKSCTWQSDTEIVKILAPLTDNPNAPNKDGESPSSFSKSEEICRILKSFNTSRQHKKGSSGKPSKKRAKKS